VTTKMPPGAGGKPKVRFTFTIDREMLSRLRDVQSRTGMSVSEQLRDGVKWWLDARQWPADRPRGPRSATPKEV
jgi:hypothetical protein